MNKTKAKRLLKLAKFLREKVPREAFDFRVICQVGEKQPLEALEAGGGCGTVACAYGWSPAVFPRQLKWIPNPFEGMDVFQRGGRRAKAFSFFTDYDDEWHALFQPGPKSSGYSGLEYTATPKQVAAHIERTVKRWIKTGVMP